LSVTVTAAERVPAAVGAKVTVIVHVPLTARGVVVEQVLVCENELAFAPVTAMLLMLRVAFPELVSVTDCVVVSVVFTAVEAKVKDVGENVTAGATTVAGPLRLTV